MKIRFRTEYYGHESLEAFHPEAGFADWHHVISGYWDEGPGHGGYVDYFLANTSKCWFAFGEFVAAILELTMNSRRNR